jgi:hemerythrin
VVEKPLHKNKKKEKEGARPNKVSIVKKITCTLKNNKGKEKVPSLMEKVKDHVDFHFSSEEFKRKLTP